MRSRFGMMPKTRGSDSMPNPPPPPPPPCCPLNLTLHVRGGKTCLSININMQYQLSGPFASYKE